MMNRQLLRAIAWRVLAASCAFAFVFATTYAEGRPGNPRKHVARASLIKSDSVVKVTATADKPDADGKQTVTVTLNIDKGWHTYANPAEVKGVDVIQTTIDVTAKEKPAKVSVDYPKGKYDEVTEGFVYENKTVIKAVIQRAKGDTGALQLSVKIQACSNEQKCLLPATVKLTVD